MDHKVSKDMISSGMIPSGEKTQADLGRIQYGSNPSPSSLADAYKSMYEKKKDVINEHHKKDADGNTIPHEGEENVDEAIITGTALLAGKLAAKALAKKALVGATKMAMKKGTTTAATKLVGKVGAKKAAGMVAKKAAMGAGESMVKNPMNTMVGASLIKPGPKMPKVPMPRDPRAKMTGARTAGVYASADLFDIVKGQLLDEGIDEKDIKYIMVNLTPDEILNEVSAKLLMKASRAADIKRAQLARAGNKAGAAAKASQASSLYQGAAKRNLAKQDLSKPLNPQRKDYPMGKGANYQQKPGM